MATLPPLISYTPVLIPLNTPNNTPARSTTLLRRDLFDARFQVLNQDEEAAEGQEEGEDKNKGKGRETFVDEGTDLVKGVYEGGLKTWECSLDLVDCLDGFGFGEGKDEIVRGKSVLELGCGTALPSCSVFARLLAEIRRSPSDPSQPPPKTTKLHLQDYNNQVLSLITLPNLLLTYAQHLTIPPPSSVASEADEDPIPTPTFTDPGELDVTPSFLESFDTLLKTENIQLVFSEGDWSGMKVAEGEEYDLVLTSETIYSVPSLPSLLDLLEASCKKETRCLVACKRIYFGVGGGELEFRRRVEERGAEVETVWGEGDGKGKSTGVGRVVMSVKWAGEGKVEKKE
ncbi:hypothetical protein BCR35DRAFT_271137 [Leucosporidium creatinivorum]|uniref:protein-histidine N-methyltransferase n=1 Tax=Leucosporidium creatinivorum TaxID=106004 RepID=A0A1Y2DHE0_9BASI|nr:hypothetical protein BCR35DRAFT_271137 [Leucosporidium creatinivorum]